MVVSKLRFLFESLYTSFVKFLLLKLNWAQFSFQLLAVYHDVVIVCLKKLITVQGRSKDASSIAFEVLLINCQIYFINFFIFNCLTLRMKLFIFKLFDVKFLFWESCLSQREENGCLWTYGRASLVSDFKLTRENDDLLSSRHK